MDFISDKHSDTQVARPYNVGGTVMFVAIVIFIFVVITAVVTALISGWASDSKQKKIARSMEEKCMSGL